MNIKELRDYLDSVLASGADPHLPVCVSSDYAASEVNIVAIYIGPFLEDPAPKMPAFLHSTGTHVFLETSEDYSWMAGKAFERSAVFAGALTKSSPPVLRKNSPRWLQDYAHDSRWNAGTDDAAATRRAVSLRGFWHKRGIVSDYKKRRRFRKADHPGGARNWRAQ
jgi:hypothetical protein